MILNKVCTLMCYVHDKVLLTITLKELATRVEYKWKILVQIVTPFNILIDNLNTP